MLEIKSLKFMNHINMTMSAGTVEVVVHPQSPLSYTERGHRGCLFSKMQFRISAFSGAKSNSRGGVRAGKSSTTQTLWEPGRHQCSRNKWDSSQNPAKVPQTRTHTCAHTHTHTLLNSRATKMLSSGLWCAMWGNLCHHLLLLEGDSLKLTVLLEYFLRMWMTTNP